MARNGAPLKINFGQRFSWTPLAFSLLLTLHFHLADGSPPQTAGRQLNSFFLKLSRGNHHPALLYAGLRQDEPFQDVHSGLPQQACDNRLFEA